MTKGSEKSKMWIAFAVGSAVFAALTSILAKIGIEDMDSNLATAIRTVVVLVLAWGDCICHWRAGGDQPYFGKKLFVLDLVRIGDGALLDLLLPCHSNRPCFEGGPHRQVQRGDHHGVGFRVSTRKGGCQNGLGRNPDYRRHACYDFVDLMDGMPPACGSYIRN